jgi:sterol desaturase/sphingolipid hydroxylase (fatty acid hydroxylase superfamily)
LSKQRLALKRQPLRTIPRKERTMSVTGIVLGVINAAIVVAILLLVGAIILWFMSWMSMGVPANVQKGYIIIVALIGLYMLVALLLGIPTLRVIGALPLPIGT